MMRKFLLSLSLITFFALGLDAQIPPACFPPNTPPSEDCESACIYCNFINGYAGTTINLTPSSVPQFCGSIENDQWFGFIAGAANATFTATPVPGSCQNNNGIQIALYQQCGGPFIQCNVGCAGCGDVAQSITVTMTPGLNYFLLIDGYAGDQCNFSISVNPPAAVQPPPLANPSPITGPSPVCPGGHGTYCINNVSGAGGYIWTIPADASIQGMPGPTVVLDAPDGRCAVIDFGPSTGTKQICVRPANSCNNGLQVCKNVVIQPIPIKILPPLTLCAEDAVGYTPPEFNGFTMTPPDFVETPGTTTTYTGVMTIAATGCDTTIKKTITVKAIPIKNLGQIILCEGTCTTIGGEMFCDAGPGSVIVPTVPLGCDSTINFTIVVLDPIADILNGGTLTCTNSTVTLNSAPQPNGPAPVKIWKHNGMQVGTGSSVTVNQPGLYILTVTQTQGGVVCSKSDSVTVNANNTQPTLSVNNGVIGCASTTATLTGTTNAPPTPTWNWNGPNGYTNSTQTATVSTPGTYTVTVTNTSNGCTNTATATVTGNTTAPIVNTTGGTLTCTTTSVTISATSNANPSTFSWNGPGSGMPSTLASPTVSTAGTYNVTVTNSTNGCTTTASATVILDNVAPNASGSVSGNIGCNNPSVTLNGSSTTPNVTYGWTGPGGFSSPLQNPTTSVTGPYVLTVTGANGCTSTADVTVNGSTTPPDATATGGTLTCTATQIQLNGNSTTSNVTYGWTGPSGYNSSIQNPFIGTPGLYTLVVTNPVNGCTTLASTNVPQDLVQPTSSATGGVIDCASGAVTIMGSTTTPGASGVWSGPGGFTSPMNNVSVTQAGNYIFEVTGPNGCTNTATAVVTLDAGVPTSFANGGVIDCNNSSVTVSGGTNAPTFIWNGPGGFTSTMTSFVVTLDGNYVLTATAANGCKSTATAFVTKDLTQPGATANGGMVTCTTPTTQISASSSTNNVTYTWSGPNAYNSSNQNPIVSDPGNYIVTVTGQNGCTSTATATVAADQNTPVAGATGGTLTCAAVAITLQGTANLTGSTFAWSGPNAFSSIVQNPVVGTAGTYTLIVTSPNGCTDQTTADVLEDIAPPEITALGDTVTCKTPSITLDGGSTTPGATFAWTGPNGFTKTISDPTTTIPGIYDLIVKAPNGCTSELTAEVFENKVKPDFTAAGGTVTCTNPSIQLTATINTANSTVQWTGPGGYLQTIPNPMATLDGFYILTVTAPNGCTDQKTVEIVDDKGQPTITATGGTLTCTILQIPLDGGSTAIGATFAWSGPSGFTSNQAGPLVSLVGTYTLVVTGPNGCTNSKTALVDKNGNYPQASGAPANVLTCTNPTTVLNASSTTTPTTDISFEWTTPGNVVISQQNPTVNAPGTYQLAVTNTSNGCITLLPVDVLQDIATPQGVVATGGTLDCINGTQQMTGATTSTGGTYLWSGPNNYTSTLQNPVVTNDGEYNFIVTLPNGCTASDTANVFKNNLSPVVMVTSSDDTLTCFVTTITLTGSTSTANTTGIWTGPGGQSSTNAMFDITMPGAYSYTVTSTTNGCKTTNSITIPQNITIPNIAVTNATLTCFQPEKVISMGSQTPGCNFLWKGPGGFIATIDAILVSIPGDYQATVQAPNGCTNTKTAVVSSDMNPPQNVEVSTDVITCTNQSPTISATTNGGTTGFSFDWTGPNQFTGTTPDVTVVDSGTYVVIVKDQLNGCTTEASTVVTMNKKAPDAMATVSDTITCTQPTVTLNAVTTVTGATFKWSGPGITASNKTLQMPTISSPGTYKVTITDPANGCTKTAQVIALTDGSNPVVNVQGETITCANPDAQLLATTDKIVTWKWSGPSGFTSTLPNPLVTVGGVYTAVATATNGCTGQAPITVNTDIVAPTVSVAPPVQFSCTVLTVPVTATATPAGINYTFDWTTSDGNIVSGANSASIVTDQVGTYTVVVTNPTNGCTTEVNTPVTANPAVPSGFVLNKKDVRCFGETNGFSSIETVQGGTPPYLYSLNGAPFSSTASFTNLAAGTYSLAVEDALGCHYTETFDIIEPPLIVVDLGPDTLLRLGDSILIDLTNAVNIPAAQIASQVLSGSFIGCDTCDVFWIKPLNSQSLVLQVIDTLGCKASDARLIQVDKQRHIYVPTAFSPDSDDNNLFYIFGGQDVLEITRFMVFDRWGEVVHEYKNFQPNDPDSGWDGNWKGEALNPAVYVWWAEIKFIDGVTKIYKGDVSLTR